MAYADLGVPTAAFTQPYKEALKERVTAFTLEELNRALPPPPVQYQVSCLNSQDGTIVGSSMAGSEVFVIEKHRIDSSLTAAKLLELIAEILCQDIGNLTLLRGGHALANKARIALEEVSSITLREALQCDAPLLCCLLPPNALRRVEPRLGEGSVEIDYERLPKDETIQSIKEERRYVTRKEDCWMVYTSKEVISYRVGRNGRNEILKPIGYFPAAPCWRLPLGTRRWGSDVWSTQLELPVRQLLHQHAAKTNDRPIPRYQMIVDPNQFVDETDAGPVWVPCEFDVWSTQRVSLVGGDRSHLEPHLAEEVARPVLAAALPLLAKLRRPQLLLEDRRLQVVFKAQRIIVPGSTGSGADSEYVGLWHVDGHREHVAAVVLYYYHVDKSLHGGDMEFCGREPMDILGWGDCSNNYRFFGRESLRSALRGDARDPPKLANCRVPIREGTLLVFSNCQMAHRVLRMWNDSGREASRDFVALFILDPAFPPLKPAQQVLSKGYATARALRLGGLKPAAAAVQLIQEFLGHLPSLRTRRRRRVEMLKEQLEPSGEVCGGSQVRATGNGCYTMVGWLHKLLDASKEDFGRFNDWDGEKYIKGLNVSPSCDRGMSEVFSLETGELEWRLEWEETQNVDMLDLAD
mmetsp:Transcript_9162/g.14919  ORF Transcript_9162/g.14919 Transcript_9162/m.14919 type:complete len:636 (-) Transcript_9162:232-2139(-)